jgi:hypothetical protein
LPFKAFDIAAFVITKSDSCLSSSTETNSAIKKTVLGLYTINYECVICPKHSVCVP